MSLFRALKAKLFPSNQTSRDPKDIHLQTESQTLSQEQDLTQEPSVAAPLFQRHFSLKIHATKADATSCEENADHGLTLYHYDTPQVIELLGWENANECCDFHHTEFDRLEISNQFPFSEQHFWLDKVKVCSITPKKNSQIKALWQVELNNLDALLISHFTLDADNIVQGDIQDYASLTGQLHRTFHQLNTEDGAGILRIITQSPGLTQAVDSNYFGERNGVTRQFNALGTLLFEGNFINDQQLGTQTWYDHEGKINQIEDRHPQGQFIQYFYGNGQLKETAEQDSNGYYINTLTRHYESGQIQLIRPLVQDIIHGIEKQYYPDGALEAERYYNQGYEYEAVWYHPNGAIKQKVFNDVTGKVIEEFYDSGKPAWREPFNTEGQLHGEHVKWYPNGQLEEKIYFEDGKEQGMALWYHDNGQLALEIYLEKGLREGLFKSYYKSGVLSAEGQYKNNLSVAPFIEYHENQQIQMYLPHTQGNRDGTARWFYEDGTIRTISEYEVRDGQGYLKESSFYNNKGILESYQSHSNTRCGYNLDNNQREYYQEGIADTRIEYYEDGAIRWLLTRTQGDLFSSKSLSPQGLILETGTIQITNGRYLDIGHWQRFTPQGKVYREAWLDEQGQLIESRHYFDFHENIATQEDEEPEWDSPENPSYDYDEDDADGQSNGPNNRTDDSEHHASNSRNNAYLSRQKYHAPNGNTATKQREDKTIADVATHTEEPILAYHLKFDDESKLYAMKRYHPNRQIAEEGNLQIQGQEQFWVGIHNQYDEQGKLKLSETYTMAGEPIEHSTSTSRIVLN